MGTGLTSGSNALATLGVGKRSLKPKVPKISPVKSYGQTITGSPDTSGPLRRARQVLAGIPTAVRVKNPKIMAAPRMKIAKGL